MAIVAAKWDSAAAERWSVFAWKDSAWSSRAVTGFPASNVPEPVISSMPTTYQHLVWAHVSPYIYTPPLLFAHVLPESSVPETTALIHGGLIEYGGAVSARRRWVVRGQQRPPEPPVVYTNYLIYTTYSDTIGVWHELPALGVDDDQCTIAPLGDTTAMVVYGDRRGLRWALLEGSRWTREGVIDPRGGIHPRLRLRPSGGLWLLWTTGFYLQVHVASYRDGVWSYGDSTRCVHPPGETYAPAWCDISRDPSERPAVAWGDLGYGYYYGPDVGCVAFPTETGWEAGEEIPGSENLWLVPLVTTDGNGDTWFAWRLRCCDPLIRFTHTYVSATSSAPAIGLTGRSRVVNWTLSELAPASWWAVLRARNDGPFEQVARVEAGATPEMSWTDTSPPAGVLRYRIRRESVDARYRWESEEARWPPKSQRPFTLSRSGTVLAEGSLDLEGADVGEVAVRVYDVQGRLVLEQTAVAGGTGRDTVNLDFGQRMKSLPNGIYFAAARDASGRVTNPLKLVILR